MNARECCVLIPSLSPDERLPQYVQLLLEGGFGGIVVVDDGSADSYQEIFDRIAGWEKCHVLHHEVNRGKGAALKTGYAWIQENTAFAGIITADSDGQHTVKDTLNLASILDESKKELLLGSRDFSRNSTQVPPKSRVGNRITSVVFKLLYGPTLPDTQTGLRAFVRGLIPFMTDIEGERFEYEMNVLIRCAVRKVPMQAVPIETVYHDENKGTHFHPIRDSWRIYKLLLGNFFKFMSSSVVATLVDFGLFFVLSHFIVPAIMPEVYLNGLNADLRILVATYGARIVSAVINFKLNEGFVFNIRNCKGAAWRYILLCIVVACISGLAVGSLTTALPGVNSTLLKVPVDLILFVCNYRIQQNWVFQNRMEEE